ncbi:MAG: sugar ABC transporter permease [Deltaproteobacteria bacterium]|nr:sugar ABC transporter permease [Deltaproteobacteria bacterium]
MSAGLGADERRQGWLLVAPALLVVAAVALYPIVAGVWLSLHRVILVFHEQRFVGLDNFAFLLEDQRFHGALLRTLLFTVVAVALELGLALPLALLLDRRAARGLLLAALLMPWAVPTAVSSRLWAWLLNPDHGVLIRLWPGAGPDLFAEPTLALLAAVLVDVWKTTPFVTLILLAGLQAIPQDLYRAAAVDGATRWQTFRTVTLPLLRPALALALLLRALDAFRVFDAIWVLTAGGPANGTETLSVYAFKTLMRTGDFGYGSALALVTFACSCALALLLSRLARAEAQP